MYVCVWVLLWYVYAYITLHVEFIPVLHLFDK